MMMELLDTRLSMLKSTRSASEMNMANKDETPTPSPRPTPYAAPIPPASAPAPAPAPAPRVDPEPNADRRPTQPKYRLASELNGTTPIATNICEKLMDTPVTLNIREVF